MLQWRILNYVIVEKDDVVEGFRIVEDTLEWVNSINGKIKRVSAF